MLRERIPQRSLPNFFSTAELQIPFLYPEFVDTTGEIYEPSVTRRVICDPEFIETSTELKVNETYSYKEGDIVYHEDDSAVNPLVYGVESGLVLLERREVYPRNPSIEQSSVVFVARPGDFFGVEDGFLGYHLATAKALVPSEIAVVERKQTVDNSEWFFREIGQRIGEVEERMLLYKPGFSLERTAYALAELSESTDDMHVVRQTHEMVAHVAGCWRETVSHKAERLEQKGIIYQREAAYIEIPDMQKLIEATGLYKKRPTRNQKRPVVTQLLVVSC